MRPARPLHNLDPQRILIVLPSPLGDLVMATPALRAWRTRFADASITCLTRPALSGLVERGGWADEVLTWEPKRRAQRRQGPIALAGRLRRRRFDWAVLLTNSFRSALLARLAGVPRRIGYDRQGRGLLLTDRLPIERCKGRIAVTRMVDYYGQLAEHLGCDPPGDRLELVCDPQDDRAIERRLAGLGIAVASGKRLVVLSPGAAFGASKLWPPERFAAAADRLIESHGAAVVVACAPGEERIARHIGQRAAQPVYVLDDPATTVGQFCSLVRRCDLLINNDAGARHIAKAFGVPIVTIFGPTHPGWTDTDYPLERRISVPVDCGPCQKKVCPLKPPRELQCLTGVTVEMVTNAAAELLARKPIQAVVEQ